MKRWTTIIFASLVLVAAMICLISVPSGMQSAEAFEPWPVEALIGNKAPDFSLGDLNGKEVSLSSFSGKPVLLNFWATWCPYCRKERSHLDKLQEQYSGKELVIVSISIDRSLEKLKTFMKNTPAQFIVLYDGQGSVASTFQVAGLPTSFLIDRNGIVKRKFTGFREWSTSSSRKIIDAFIEG